MSITTQSAGGSYVKRTAVIRSQSIAEIKFSDREMGEIIAVYPQVSANSCEIGSGRVTYGGRLICTVVYVDGDGKLCRVQKGAEFSHFADDASLAPAQIPLLSLSVDRTQVRRDGSSYLLGAVVCAEIEVYCAQERNYLTAVDGAVALTETKTLFTAVTFSGESEIDDDFDCNAQDVLIPAAEVVVTDCEVRVGEVEIRGEIYLSVLAVRDGKPVCFDRIVPFKSEISCSEALVGHKATCRAEIKQISVEASVDDEKGKCGVAATFEMSFCGSFYEEEQVNLISDAFSTTNSLNLNFAEEQTSPCIEIKVFSEHIAGKCASKAKLDGSCNLLAAALPKVEFARVPIGIEGSIGATLIYEQNGEVHSTQIDLPFCTQLVGMEGSCGNVKVAVSGVNVRLVGEGECEAEAALKICADDLKCEDIKYVCGMEEGEKNSQTQSAVSVYFADAGEDMWSVAKKCRQSPETIQSFNQNLTFPLRGNERVIVFRGKN